MHRYLCEYFSAGTVCPALPCHVSGRQPFHARSWWRSVCTLSGGLGRVGAMRVVYSRISGVRDEGRHVFVVI